MKTKCRRAVGRVVKIMPLSLFILSTPPMQGAASLVGQLFYTDLNDLPEEQVAVEEGEPHAADHEDFLDAEEDASKEVTGGAVRDGLSTKTLAMVATRQAKALHDGVSSTFMHRVEVTPQRHNQDEMGCLTVLLIRDTPEIDPAIRGTTSLPGYTQGGFVDPLGLGEATVVFILLLITEGFLKATSGVAQPWRLCCWIDLAFLHLYRQFCQTKGVDEETMEETTKRLSLGSRLQVRVARVCFFRPYYNFIGRSSLSSRACVRFTCRSSA